MDVHRFMRQGATRATDAGVVYTRSVAFVLVALVTLAILAAAPVSVLAKEYSMGPVDITAAGNLGPVSHYRLDT